MTHTLREIAERVGAVLHGTDGDCPIRGIGTLQEAHPGQLSFFANPLYRKQLGETQASAVLLSANALPTCPVPALVVEEPYVAFAQVMRLFHPQPRVEKHELSAGALIAEDCNLGEPLSIAPRVVIGAGSCIGAGSRIGIGCVLEEGVSVGRDCLLHPNVTLCKGVVLGDRVIVHPGAVIGADGFGFAWRGEQGWLKIPQAGGVRVGDDVEIGANVCIDRGTLQDTVIGRGVILDNLVQIAHNVCIGEYTAIASGVGVAGSVQIGSRCQIGGLVGINGHIQIVDDVRIAGMSSICKSILQAGTYSSVIPAMEVKHWHRLSALLPKLDKILRELKKATPRVRS
ncbi:MAG: UDP-3-O-(3-hydroxymyristoyl)glucosamine N-acyltransferase [Candidatus Eutrophobiaceae bacterium]